MSFRPFTLTIAVYIFVDRHAGLYHVGNDFIFIIELCDTFLDISDKLFNVIFKGNKFEIFSIASQVIAGLLVS